MNFWLTVLTGISDPKLVFGFHSSPPVMSELVLIYENSMNNRGNFQVRLLSGTDAVATGLWQKQGDILPSNHMTLLVL